MTCCRNHICSGNTLDRCDTETVEGPAAAETRVVSNEEQLLRQLMDVHGRVVRIALARREYNRQDVEELWGDVFELAFERIAEIAGLPESLQRTWLIRTANFLTANHGRRSATRRRTFARLRREPLQIQPSAQEEFDTRAEIGESERRSEAIRITLSSLHVAHREVLVLHALGYDGPGIADQLGISAVAARKRLMRARVAFRLAFDEPNHLSEPSRAER